MKKLAVTLAAVMVAISVVAVNLWLRLHEVNAQTTQLRERVTVLQSAQLATTTAPGTPAAPVASAPGTAAPANGQVQAAAPKAAGTRDSRSEDELMEGLNRIFSTPEGREMLRAQARMTLPAQYPDLAKELRLTPAEEEKLFDLLAKHQVGTAADSLGAVNETMDRAAIQEQQRKAQEQRRANEAELTAALGSKYSQWQEYQKALPSRRQVNQLQASLGGGNNTLTESQSRPLIAALAAEQARIQEDQRNAPRPAAVTTAQGAMEQQLQRLADTNRRLVNAASAHLNPQQLDSYRRQLEQQENLQRATLRSINLQENAGGQAVPPPPPPPR